MRRTIVKSLIVLVCGLWCAQVSTRAQCGVLEDWEFHLTPYLWLPAMDVDSTVSGVTTSLDLSFGDIVDKFSIFGVSGRLEMWNRDLGFSLDTMYISLDGDFSGQAPGRTIPFPPRPIKIPGPSFNVDVDIGQFIMEMAGTYRVLKLPLSSGRQYPALWFEPYGGLRFVWLEQKIQPTISTRRFGTFNTSLGGAKTFLDPFFGARIVFPIVEKFRLAVRGDVGGFGVGSDLTWQTIAGFDYRPWKSASFKLGYKAFYIDYSHGSGTSEFGLDGIMHGPWLGATFYF